MSFPPHSLPRAAVPFPCARCLRNHTVAARSRVAWACSTGCPTRDFGTETSGSPRFPGSPSSTCPALRPRRRWRTRPAAVLLLLPSTFETVSATATFPDFGAQSRGLCSRCVRFAAEVTLDDATLATEWWGHTFSDGTFTRWGTLLSFVLVELHLHSSQPELFLAHLKHQGTTAMPARLRSPSPNMPTGALRSLQPRQHITRSLDSGFQPHRYR
jgi:hypothetical protein